MSSGIHWPLGLPLPLLGSTVSTAEGRIMTQGDIAVAERVIHAGYRNTLPVRWRFNREEKQAFEGWYFHYLDDGVNWFYMQWLEGRTGLARFIAPYQLASDGLHWRVFSTVETDYALSR